MNSKSQTYLLILAVRLTTNLNLSNNQLIELPKEIDNFTKITSLDLSNNHKLVLTKRQKEWIKKLISKYGTGWEAIYIDDDLLDRTNLIPTINIDYDEIPF